MAEPPGAQAEEVTSETFLAAWRGRESVEVSDHAIRPWLLGIAARQSFNATGACAGGWCSWPVALTSRWSRTSPTPRSPSSMTFV